MLRSSFDMQPTKAAYNQIVDFYFLLIAENPQGFRIPTKEDGGGRYYELLTANHPFVKGFPSPRSRAAISQGIRVDKSWNSTHEQWLNRPKRMKHHKPPVPPRTFNFNPHYDEGMWKEDELGITRGFWE